MFLKSVHKDVKYYEFGKIYTFEFFISGYPLPLSNEMKWEFKSCQNFPWCTNNETQAQVNNLILLTLIIIASIHLNKTMWCLKIIENGTLIPTSEVTQKFKIRIKTIVSGTLSFTASNSLGNSTDQHLVFVTGKYNLIMHISNSIRWVFKCILNCDIFYLLFMLFIHTCFFVKKSLIYYVYIL